MIMVSYYDGIMLDKEKRKWETPLKGFNEK